MKLSTSILAVAISLTAPGTFVVAHAQGTAQPPHTSSILSEQVKSDLADWQKAGFDAHSQDVLSYDVFGTEYQQRYAKYKELRKQHTNQAVRN